MEMLTLDEELTEGKEAVVANEADALNCQSAKSHQLRQQNNFYLGNCEDRSLIVFRRNLEGRRFC